MECELTHAALGCPRSRTLLSARLLTQVNWESGFLIIVIIVMTVMVLLGSLCAPRPHPLPPLAAAVPDACARPPGADVLVYFQAEEDKNTAIAPKIGEQSLLLVSAL